MTPATSAAEPQFDNDAFSRNIEATYFRMQERHLAVRLRQTFTAAS